MLYIAATGSSEVIVTLYEKSSNVINPYFTWELYSKDRNETYIMTQDDHSSIPYYYNSFTMSISSTGATQGGVDLINGEYRYKIHEMLNPYTLDLGQSLGIVETGLLIVGLTSSIPTILSYTQSNTTVIPRYTNHNK
jgi:hypothetical protein